MSDRPDRRREPGVLSAETILLWGGLALLALGAGTVWAALHLSALLFGTAEDLPLNPFTLLLYLLLGEVSWTRDATRVLVGIVAGVLLAFILVRYGLRRRHRSRSRVDDAASYLARSDELAALSESGARATARRLGVTSAVGVPIGRTLHGGQMLYGSWEDMHIDIWGPRTGKTTSRAIPAILDAPGAVLVTSNKRDVVDATREVRAVSTNAPVWVFDPQGIALEEPTWWWDPLSYVTDEVRAAQLAEHFATGSRNADAHVDAYFDPAGQDLLAGLLLAAALDGRPITDVYTWLTRPTDETPVEILDRGGFPLTADAVSGVVNAPEKQRGGIYGTAAQMAHCLTNQRITRWITTSGPDDDRPRFDPAEFLASGGTLYSLSKEGKGTAGPLVTALTVAVVETAEEQAARSAGGRLSTPLLGVLDEVANVCRWAELPNMYSHYGSRGIVLMAILQSWSQGVEVWGQEGMRKLWSAANVKVYGGGVAEAEFLGELSQLIGDYDMRTVSVSEGRDGRSATRQLRRETTLNVADLGALPRGRAIVLASGVPPTLVKTVPWMVGPYATAVSASIAAHDPAKGGR